MSDPRLILENSYQRAASNQDVLPYLSETQREWIETIVKKAESQKAVVAALVTSLVKKIETPTQDVRYHKVELPNGYSGRSFDTKFITPFIRGKFRRIAMKESGWLTRSIEQAHAFTLNFPGKILNTDVKNAFLQILNDVEVNHASAENYLCALFALLIKRFENFKVVSTPILGKGAVIIETIIEILKSHFFLSYGVAGASRLPVLAIYSIYELLMTSDRYKDMKLCPLKSHTTSDIKSLGIGDIEILDEQGNFFEGVEIKHNITITSNLIQDVFNKFANTTVRRYYILTTAQEYVDDENEVKNLIHKIHNEHGCEVIVNGITPSIKYYLRLLSNPTTFLDCYTKNLQAEFDVSSDIKEVHLQRWNDLLQSISETS